MDTPGMPPYARLAEALRQDIATGSIDVGTRLPAHRELAAELGLAVGTVTRAYAVLEREGLVRGEHGRGTFVTGDDAGATDLVDLSVNVSPPALGAKVLRQALEGLPQTLPADVLSTYPEPAGSPRHRAAMAAWLTRQGVGASADRVLITHGAQHAITVALIAASASGGSVFTEHCTYPGALHAARQAGQRLVPVATDELGMVAEALDAALRACGRGGSRTVYVTPTVHNPTGATMDERRRRDIVQVCRDHDVDIIEDEVYSIFRPDGLTPLAALAPERTWYVNGLSKSLSPSLRVGVLAVPEAHGARARAALQTTTHAVSPLMAELVVRWIRDGTAEDAAMALRAESEERLGIAAAVLGGYLPFVPSGGFHLWLPMSRQRAEESERLAARAGVLVTPSREPMTAPGGEEGGIRLCLGGAAESALSLALGRLRVVLEGGSPHGWAG